ncbi:MAG: glycosyltransferase family 2 protein [Chloroflexi bacterium]|nr:glycosyltransferase family 2 protein [Chloroflexota bacterium]
MIDVAVIVVSWNVRDYLVKCLRSVYAEFKRSGLNGEVWVVDNASTDGTIALLGDLFPQVHLISNDRNVGFGAANNQGMQAAAASDSRYYFLLNPDTVLHPGALAELVRCLDDRPEAGMAGARLVYGDGRFQHSAFSFPGITQLMFDLFPVPARLYESRWNGRYPRSLYRRNGKPFAVDHPLGATMLVRAEVAEATKGFDESYHMYCEEIDWSWRVQTAGWKIYAVPSAEIVHYSGESTRQVPSQSVINLWRSRAQLYQQHHGRFRLALARWLVIKGMRKKASRATEPELKHAYEEVVRIWQTSNSDEPGEGQAASVQVASGK